MKRWLRDWFRVGPLLSGLGVGILVDALNAGWQGWAGFFILWLGVEFSIDKAIRIAGDEQARRLADVIVRSERVR